MLSAAQCSKAYIEACEVELQAFKPGNVSIYSPAHDMTVADFRLSAELSAPALCCAEYSLGEKIYYAIKATRSQVYCNTNLGIVLLCAPLIQAAMQCNADLPLRSALERVLADTTQSDAVWVYQAINLASPAGIGDAEQQDVKQTPSVTLLQAMQIAAEKDLIAKQYCNGFKDILDFAILQYNSAFVLSGDCGWAALTVFCEMLALYPDSHIERKYGKQYSEWIAAEMLVLQKALQSANKLDDVLPILYALDKTFKAKRINPGTTADITVATVLVNFLEKLIGNSDCWSVKQGTRQK